MTDDRWQFTGQIELSGLTEEELIEFTKNQQDEQQYERRKEI